MTQFRKKKRVPKTVAGLIAIAISTSITSILAYKFGSENGPAKIKQKEEIKPTVGVPPTSRPQPTFLSDNNSLISSNEILSAIALFGLPALPFSSAAQLLPDESIKSPQYAYPLIVRTAYLSAYNTRIHQPDWTISHHSRKQLDFYSSDSKSEVTRDNSSFHSDLLLEPSHRLPASLFLSTGYDRGHITPAADAKISQQAINETFYMTNISPQSPGFNRGYWAAVEAWARDLIRVSSKNFENISDVFVVSGPLFLPKQVTNKSIEPTSTIIDIAKEHDKEVVTSHTFPSQRVSYDLIPNYSPVVPVPTHFFKIILTVRNLDSLNDGSLSNKDFALSAFILPNESIPISTPLENFVVPLESLELKCGYKFFPILRQHLQSIASKSKLKSNKINMINANAQTHESEIHPISEAGARSICSAISCDLSKFHQIQQNFNKHKHPKKNENR